MTYAGLNNKCSMKTYHLLEKNTLKVIIQELFLTYQPTCLSSKLSRIMSKCWTANNHWPFEMLGIRPNGSVQTSLSLANAILSPWLSCSFESRANITNVYILSAKIFHVILFFYLYLISVGPTSDCHVSFLLKSSLNSVYVVF